MAFFVEKAPAKLHEALRGQRTLPDTLHYSFPYCFLSLKKGDGGSEKKRESVGMKVSQGSRAFFVVSLVLKTFFLISCIF